MMILRPSQVDAWLTCGRKFYYQYVLGLMSSTGAANLYFGTSIHYGIEIFLKTGCKQTAIDAFYEKWDSYTSEKTMEYPQPFCRDSLRKTGCELIQSFHDWWPTSGFTITYMHDGQLAVEQRLRARISEDVILSGGPDIVASNGADVGPLDWKSVKTQHASVYADLSDQLTAYSILIDSNRHLIDLEDKKIGFAAFIDMQKKKVPEPLKKDKTKYPKNAVWPHVFPPIISTIDRTKLVFEYVEKVKWVAENIRQKRFFRVPGKAFNSPCANCDYSKHCSTGRDDSLVLSERRYFQIDQAVKDLNSIPFINL